MQEIDVKVDNDEIKQETCPYFRHHKRDGRQWHGCNNPNNVTRRCGFSAEDWPDCIIHDQAPRYFIIKGFSGLEGIMQTVERRRLRLIQVVKQVGKTYDAIVFGMKYDG